MHLFNPFKGCTMDIEKPFTFFTEDKRSHLELIIPGHPTQKTWKIRWDKQINAFPQITWAVHSMKADEPFAQAWDAVNDALAARRNTRDFQQWNPICKYAADVCRDGVCVEAVAYMDKLAVFAHRHLRAAAAVFFHKQIGRAHV